MKARFFTLVALLAFALATSAQTATDVLNNTAQKLKNCGGIEATFEATSFQGTTEEGTTSGTIYIKEDKFKINTPDAHIWFDGKTQWALYANSDEVNVSNPTKEELQSINPYNFINFYKHGFEHSMTDASYNGKACYNVRMVPQNPMKIKEMFIVIDKSSLLPYSIRIRQNNDWFRIRVLKVNTEKKWKDSFFRFDKKEYPNVEVIDLR